MAYALFDLDNTLLAGDSDYLWGEFLCEQGIVDRDVYQCANREFYEQYANGSLDIYAFLAFAFKVLSEHDYQQLSEWRVQFFAEKIKPIILPKAEALVSMHREKGDTIIIITATNSFVTSPMARHFGADKLIATEPEFKNGQFTGQVADIPCFREGKVKRLNAWLGRAIDAFDETFFYSDSHNDIPLLEQVSHPVAVDPDQTLEETAKLRDWSIISLR